MTDWNTYTIKAPQHVIELLLNDQAEVDFNTLVPEPSPQEQQAWVKTWSNMPSWLHPISWRDYHWGAGANACETHRESDDAVRFRADDFPTRIFEELAKQSGECITAIFTEEHGREEIEYTFHARPDGNSYYDERLVRDLGAKESETAPEFVKS